MLWIILSLIAALAILALLFLKPSSDADKDQIKLFRTVRFVGLVSILLLWGMVTIYWSVYSLDNRSVAVTSAFGSIDLYAPVTTPGPFLVAPWKSVTEMEIRGAEIDVETGGNSLSQDKVGLNVSVSLPYALNANYAPHVLARIGDQKRYEDRLKSSAQTALRDAVAEFPWADAAVNRRGDFEVALHNRVKTLVAQQLQALGFTEEEAQNAFTFLPLQVKQITPPERIVQSNAELAAAVIDLQRQQTITQQAAEVARRQTNVGSGINNMLAQLPQPVKDHLTEKGVADIIRAQAFEEQSLSVKAAVESGKVGALTIVVSPSGSDPIALK